MRTLERTQAAFHDYIRRGSIGIEAEIADGPELSADSRLLIYFSAYRSRLREVLEADYPAVRAFVGDEGFEALALEYLDAHPSTHPNARWFGRHFPDFLQERGEPTARGVALSELARFERAMGLAFDARDDAVLVLGALSGIPAGQWPALCMRLHGSVSREALRTNAPAMRLAADGGLAMPETETHAGTTTWITWRRAGTVRFRALEADENGALAALAAGEPFATMCEGLLQHHEPEAAFARAAQLVRRWVEEELLADALAFGTSPAP